MDYRVSVQHNIVIIQPANFSASTCSVSFQCVHISEFAYLISPCLMLNNVHSAIAKLSTQLLQRLYICDCLYYYYLHIREFLWLAFFLKSFFFFWDLLWLSNDYNDFHRAIMSTRRRRIKPIDDAKTYILSCTDKDGFMAIFIDSYKGKWH